MPFVIENGGRQQLMGLTGKVDQLLTRFGAACGLGKQAGAKGEDLITAQNQRLRVALRQFQGLRLGQGIGDVAGGGVFGLQCGAQSLFIDAGRMGLHRNPRVLQQGQADGGLRGQKQRDHAVSLGDRSVDNAALF